MLVELRVRDLGVIDDTTITFGPGMTALTGETGAGKTLVVEALGLLLGGRADPVIVRSGAKEALVEGRFVEDDPELDPELVDLETVLARVIPASGRSRAWVNGRMSTAAGLSEEGSKLVDLYGQHAHQSLLDQASQRTALDQFANVDTVEHARLRAEVRRIASEISRLGGDEMQRARESDLLRHQVEEIASAGIDSPDEDDKLRAEQSRLSDAAELRLAAQRALSILDAEGGVLDSLGKSVALLGAHEALSEMGAHAHAVQADAADLASDLRTVVETWEDDPDRLAAIAQRRAKLAELRRKYGSTLGDVIAFGRQAEESLSEMELAEVRLKELSAEEEIAKAALAKSEREVKHSRLAAAPRLGAEVASNLQTLAMPEARVEVSVGDDAAGEDVVFLLGANPGEPPLALSKVASGGELARTMLALRLVITGGRPTLVFDEVDAGIGGAAADAVGRALSALAEHSQVLVVTHLPQVAAFAENQIVVEKRVRSGRTSSVVHAVTGDERAEELARMLSGRPASASAIEHAHELLEEAESARAARKKTKATKSKGKQRRR